MTLQELVYSLKKAMLANPLVHTWIDDFNFTSAYHDIKYGAAALDIGLFNVDRKGFMTVNVNLYCFDRMYDEPSDSKMVRTENNSLPLYSKCMMVVQNAIKTMDTRIGIVDATYQPFRHKYTDDCAGVLCQLTLTAPFTICYDDFYEPIPIPDVTLNAIISHGSVAATVNGVPVQLPYTAPRGTQVQLLVNPDDGYAFVEWSDHNTQNPRQVTMTTDLTLACECVVPVVTHVIVATATNGTITGSGVYNEGAPVLLKVTPSQHYHLNEGAWTGLPSSATFNADFTEASFTADADYTILVNCVEDAKYVVTVSCEHCTSTSGGEFYEGDLVTLIAEPDLHYHMSATSWNGLPYWAERSADYQTVTFTIDNQNYNVTATGRIDKHTFTVQATNASYVSEGGTYDYGSTQHAMVTPLEGYHCVEGSWTGLPDDAVFNYNYTSVDFTLDQDRTIICNCYPDVPTTHTITVTADNGTPYGSGTYAHGTEVTIGVTPNEHYHFDHWTDGDYPNPRTIIVTADASYHAVCVEDEKFTLQFNGNFCSCSPSSFTGYLGQQVEVDVVDITEHYHWGSWNDGSTAKPRTFTVEGSAIYTATCEIDQHTITTAVTPVGSGTIIGGGTYNYGASVTLTANHAEGYYFVQWQDGVTDNPRTITVTGDATYTATFEVVPVTNHIITIGNAYAVGVVGGTGVIKIDDTHYSVPDDTSVGWSLTAIYPGPTSGYYGLNSVTVNGTSVWSGLAQYGFSGTISRVLTDYGILAGATATIVQQGTLLSVGDVRQQPWVITATCTHGVVTGGGRYNTGTSVTLNFTPDDGYGFDHWSDGDTNNPRTITVGSSDASYHTDGVVVPYTISATCDHGTVSGTGSYVYGSTCELTCTPSAHWNFVRWTENGEEVSTSNPYSFTVNRSRTLVAVVEEDTKYTISASATHGSIAGAGEYYVGDTCNLVVTPESHYHCELSSWSGLPSSATYSADYKTATFIVDNTYSVNADCIEDTKYTLTFSSLGNGSVTATVDGASVSTGTQVYENQSVVLTGTADDGYRFKEFKDELETVITTNPYSFSMPATNKTFTCEFELRPVSTYTLTFSAEEGGSVEATVNGVEVTSPATVHEGDAVVLTAVGELGYIFDGFEDEEGIIIVDTPYEFSMPSQDKTFVARFSPEVVGGYLCFTPVTTEESDPDAPAQATIYLENLGTNNPQCLYSTDGENWSAVPTTSTSAVTFQQPIYLKGVNPSGFSTSGSKYSVIHLTGLSGSKVEASGSVMSLIDGVGESTTISASYCFLTLFYQCTDLFTAPSLPATTLAQSCYSSMFYGCTALTSAPSLPALTLAYSCYDSMFDGCTSLTSAPALPATTLADFCYSSMFYGCTALTSAPTLPATTLADFCYASMFKGCTALTSAPALPATTLAEACYDSMFNGCTSLTGPVRISATTAPSTTYTDSMFTNSGTSRPSTPTDYNKIYVGGNVSLWNSANAGIDSTYWTVQLITEDADDQLPDEPQSE